MLSPRVAISSPRAPSLVPEPRVRFLPVLLALVGPAVILALPALRWTRLPRELAWACAKALVLLVVPGVVYLLSAWLVPDWKGAAVRGWLDGFHLGKLALSPLVAWGLLAAWAHEIWRPEALSRAVVLGYVAGALASGLCSLVGLLVVPIPHALDVWLLVPFYTAAWFTWRAAQLLGDAPPGGAGIGATVASAAALFAASLVWSARIYAQLPDEAPDCFVVTAASRGHRRLVGPLRPHLRGGRWRPANRQLLTFWALEAAWQARWPRGHRNFRRVYGVVGPLVARRLAHPLLADLCWLALKPAEWLARGLLARWAGLE